jgi:hypothetical protein
MRGRWCPFALAALLPLAALAGCTRQYTPPPPLPPPPRPLPSPTDEPGAEPEPPPGSQAWQARRRAAADRETTLLQLGFQECRTLGRRIDPRLSGRAVLAVRIDAAGTVIAASVARVDSLPAPVVSCLLDRVRTTRFAPRGGTPTDLVIPIDLTRPGAQAPRVDEPTRTIPPAGTIQL